MTSSDGSEKPSQKGSDKGMRLSNSPPFGPITIARKVRTRLRRSRDK